jgi:hypothetical protein
MKTIFNAILLIVFVSFRSGVYAQDTNMVSDDMSMHKHVMINPSDLKWVDGPAALPKGVKVALLEGNPAEAGPYTIRVMFPANFEVRPHWHPTTEHVSVIKGTLYMGTQEKFDKAMAKPLSEGGFALMPAKFVHFVFTKEPVTIQLHGIGPFAITYVNKNDDPRNKTPM